MHNGALKIFAGNSNPNLVKEIVKYLGLDPGRISVGQFSDAEISVKIEENVRGMDIFVVQSTSRPVNHTFMELLIMLDAFKRASADRITAVIPYFGYARQDRKDQPRVPITAKLAADLITRAGANRILTIDLHSGQIQGFFDIPVDHLFAAPIFIDYFKRIKLDNAVVVSPDMGSAKRARAFAARMNFGLALIDKRRPRANISEVMNVIGEIEGKTALILDDMVDTADTLIKAAEAVEKQGAKEVYAGCSHAVLSGLALRRIEKSNLKKMVVSNTISLKEEAKECRKIEVLSVANLLGEAIKRIHEGSSVSSLFV
ncbi:MAG: ribose-phosphate pyrophosphokinase [Candidatus Ratteibacteria bacterium]|nr:ribose-phosphate pyrophosphokinase [Candidatus Ratteibacteria bacterium]